MKMSKNNSFSQAHQSLKIVVVILLFIIFNIISQGNLIHAMDWDNVKSYNQNTKTITIINALGFGDQIAEIKLNSNFVEQVPMGYQKVAEIEINNYDDYDNALKKMSFYDKKDNMKGINREFDYKYKTIEEYEIPVLRQECSYIANGSYSCKNVQIGTTTKGKVVWKELSSKDLKKGDNPIIIGIFTNVQDGDYIEWIPTFFGVEINEWAVWLQSFNVGIKRYYTFNESSGTTAFESVQGLNLTGIPNQWEAGLIGNANRADGGYDNMGFNLSSVSDPDDNAFSINFWINFTANPSGKIISDTDGTGANENGEWEIELDTDGVNSKIYSAGGILETGFTQVSYNVYQMVTYIFNGTTGILYINGTQSGNYQHTPTFNAIAESTNLFIYGRSDGVSACDADSVRIDELSFWNRTLTTSEITNLYNNGVGLSYNSEGDTSSYSTVTLDYPNDEDSFSTSLIEFNSTITPYNSNVTNATIYVWTSSGTLVNSTTNVLTGETANKTFWDIMGFNLGNYKWNVLGCGNASDNNYNCSWASNNNTFIIGSTVNNVSYINNVFETSSQTFSANLGLISGSVISLAQLVYNGTNYTISSISLSGNNAILTKTIDIPLSSNSFQNTTKDFFFRFTYEGDTVQETSTYVQNVSYINLQLCNATYSIQALNFTITDEVTLTNISTSSSPITFQNTFKYWLGSGNVYKNYSYQQINGSAYNLGFCIYPYNSSTTFKTDLDNSVSAYLYSENNYYMRNASLTSTQNNIIIYLLSSTDYTKFYVTITQGISFVTDAIVNIAKNFIGDGSYKTVGIKLTDNNGKFPFYADLDGSYQFSITKNGQLLGVVEKVASCETAPCTLEINIAESVGDIFEPYYDIYAQNVLSNLSYDPSIKIVTYRFVDTTGLAQYFRLKVQKVSLNKTIGESICDINIYSSAGTLTCNMTNYDGDFFAHGYISRSPEKLDKFISFIIHETFTNLGFMGLFLTFAILVTVVIGSAAISRGDPTTVLISLSTTILLLKLATIFPFGWTVVVILELIIVFMITRMTN